MISKELLTVENGFEDGVVVLVITNNSSLKPQYYEWKEKYKDSIDWGYYYSIKPLTGKMAIWNFAPGWANLCMTNSRSYAFYVRELTIANFEVHSKRPFWA